jgi:hypothetical protein
LTARRAEPALIPDMPDAAATPDSKSSAKRGRTVKTDAIRVSPALEESVLASPFKRAAGMAIDLAAIVLLSALANPILGVFTGLTFASLGSRRVSDAKFWLAFRWVLIGLGGLVMILSATQIVGTPIIKTGVFNIARDERQTAPDPIILPPGASAYDLQRAVNRYRERDEFLTAENKAMHERGAGRSLLTATADLGKTFGLTFGWAGVYFTLLTSLLLGRTLGKLLMRTRVVRLDGRAITPMDAFIRNGGYAAGIATGMIGFMSLLWHQNRQAIHDRMAATVVVLESTAPVSVTPPEAGPGSVPTPSDSPTAPS